MIIAPGTVRCQKTAMTAGSAAAMAEDLSAVLFVQLYDSGRQSVLSVCAGTLTRITFPSSRSA